MLVGNQNSASNQPFEFILNAVVCFQGLLLIPQALDLSTILTLFFLLCRMSFVPIQTK